MFLAFDTPVPFSTMGRRNVSNVPAQALTLMNDPMVVRPGPALGRARRWPRPAAPTAQRLDELFIDRLRPPADRPTRSAPCLAFLAEPGRAGAADARRRARLGRPLPCADQYERVYLRRLNRDDRTGREGSTPCTADDSLNPA